jgi:signal transduction histidine kinase
MHILIIDNKKTHGQKIKKLLENSIADCLAEISYSALEALTELRNTDYSALIISSDLPEAAASDILTLIADSGTALPAIIITDTETEQLYTQIDTAGCGVYYLARKIMAEMLPFAIMEMHKQFILFQENNRIKNELKQAQFGQKIVEMALDSNHRINNPLMTILGNAQLLLRDSPKDNSTTVSRLEKIERAAKRIREITMNLANGLEVQSKPKETAKSLK